MVCPCLPSIRILLVRYAPRCIMGSSADRGGGSSDQPSRPASQGRRRMRRLRKRSYVNFDDVDDDLDGEKGGSRGRSGTGTMSLTAVGSSTPASSTFGVESKKSPWDDGAYRLATLKRHSTGMVDHVTAASEV